MTEIPSTHQYSAEGDPVPLDVRGRIVAQLFRNPFDPQTIPEPTVAAGHADDTEDDSGRWVCVTCGYTTSNNLDAANHARQSRQPAARKPTIRSRLATHFRACRKPRFAWWCVEHQRLEQGPTKVER